MGGTRRKEIGRKTRGRWGTSDTRRRKKERGGGGGIEGGRLGVGWEQGVERRSERWAGRGDEQNDKGERVTKRRNDETQTGGQERQERNEQNRDNEERAKEENSRRRGREGVREETLCPWPYRTICCAGCVPLRQCSANRLLLLLLTTTRAGTPPSLHVTSRALLPSLSPHNVQQTGRIRISMTDRL